MTAGRRAYLVGLFAVYLVLLVWTVLWKLNAPWTGGETMVKIVPFVATSEAGPNAPLEVIANLLLFVPFGLYLRLLAPTRRWWTAGGMAAGTSLALEVGQYVLGVGRSDTTDLLVNTAGGLAGLVLLTVARRRLGIRTSRVMTPVLSVGTAVVLLVAGLYVSTVGPIVHVDDVGPRSRIASSPVAH